MWVDRKNITKRANEILKNNGTIKTQTLKKFFILQYSLDYSVQSGGMSDRPEFHKFLLPAPPLPLTSPNLY